MVVTGLSVVFDEHLIVWLLFEHLFDVSLHLLELGPLIIVEGKSL